MDCLVPERALRSAGQLLRWECWTSGVPPHDFTVNRGIYRDVAAAQTAPICDGNHPYDDLVMTRTPAGPAGTNLRMSATPHFSFRRKQRPSSTAPCSTSTAVSSRKQIGKRSSLEQSCGDKRRFGKAEPRSGSREGISCNPFRIGLAGPVKFSIRAPREGRDGRSAMPFCLNYLTSERCEPVDLEASISLFLKARMSKNLWANDFRDSRTYR